MTAGESAAPSTAMQQPASNTMDAVIDEKCQSKSPTRRLLTLSEIPSWMRDNDYLVTGYRPPQPSFLSCLQPSLLTLSNDTVNIYTHLIGFLLLVPTAITLLSHTTSLGTHIPLPTCLSNATVPSLTESYLHFHGLHAACIPPRVTSSLSPLAQKETESSRQDTQQPAYVSALQRLLWSHRRAMLPFLCAALCCLAFSSTFHIFSIRSAAMTNTLVRLDYVGIVLLCAGHGYTGVYYLFYCNRETTSHYNKIITAALAMAVPAILSPRFATSAARTARAMVFTSLGSVALVPVTHALFRVRDSLDLFAILASTLTLFTYAVGASVYVSRFPECCRVGRHDRFFASHQLMHVSVLVGIVLQLGTLYYLFTIRMRYGCSPPPSLFVLS